MDGDLEDLDLDVRDDPRDDEAGDRDVGGGVGGGDGDEEGAARLLGDLGRRPVHAGDGGGDDGGDVVGVGGSDAPRVRRGLGGDVHVLARIHGGDAAKDDAAAGREGRRRGRRARWAREFARVAARRTRETRRARASAPTWSRAPSCAPPAAQRLDVS